MARLLAETDEVFAGRGRAVFLLGEAGSGKTALLGVFEELAHRRHGQLQTGYVLCGAGDEAAPAWRQLDEHFTHAARMRSAALALVPDWLQVIPIVGPIASAMVVTVKRLRGGPVRRRHRVERSGGPSVLDHVRSLVEHGQKHPSLVMLDRFELASPDELAGASALIHRLHETRILIVIAARTMKGRVPEGLRSLLQETERKGRAKPIVLSGFDREQLLEVVSLVVGGMIPPAWLDWLAAETGGRPGDLWDLLGRLEHAGKIRRTRKTWELIGDPPAHDESAADQNDAASITEAVEDGARGLLALAAAEGESFHSAVLAELAGIPELDVEDRLAPLVRAGLIKHLGEHEIGQELTSRYAFDSPRSARAFASLLSPDERSATEARASEIHRGLASGAD